MSAKCRLMIYRCFWANCQRFSFLQCETYMSYSVAYSTQNLVKLLMRRNNDSDLQNGRFDGSLTILLKLEKPLLAHSGFVVSSQATTRQMGHQRLFLFGVKMERKCLVDGCERTKIHGR